MDIPGSRGKKGRRQKAIVGCASRSDRVVLNQRARNTCDGSSDPLKTGHVLCGNEFVHAELVKIIKGLGK